MTRERLPDRRVAETTELEHAGFRFTVTVGFDLDGRPKEVFADGTRIGTDLAHVISDACVVLSLALQHGCPPGLLPKSMGRVPDPARGTHATRPASVMGTIAAVVAEAGSGRQERGR